MFWKKRMVLSQCHGQILESVGKFERVFFFNDLHFKLLRFHFGLRKAFIEILWANPKSTWKFDSVIVNSFSLVLGLKIFSFLAFLRLHILEEKRVWSKCEGQIWNVWENSIERFLQFRMICIFSPWEAILGWKRLLPKFCSQIQYEWENLIQKLRFLFPMF